jgi:uncharacterized membrane protein YtjA (UPF0391 family)
MLKNAKPSGYSSLTRPSNSDFSSGACGSCAACKSRHRDRQAADRVGGRTAEIVIHHSILKTTNAFTHMLHYAVVFLIVAIIAAVLGFGTLAGTAALIAKICFVVFLIFALLTFLKKK